MKPKVLILRAAGVNCDAETAYAFEIAGAAVESVHVNEFTRGRRKLDEFDLLTLPGGFTYGDDVSAGRILAIEIRFLLGEPLRDFIESGRLVLGICNGFQALVKAGLLPGWSSKPGNPAGDFPPQQVTLAENRNGRFQCRWVRLRVHEAAAPPFLSGLNNRVIEVPIAHGEGRFLFEGEPPSTLMEQIAFQYCGENGEVDDRFNVNGSSMNAAGLSGFDGRVLGLMPHPERHVNALQHPRWTREGRTGDGDGLDLFRSAVSYLGQR